MKHRIYVVGMGPGQENMMTQEAMQVLEASPRSTTTPVRSNPLYG